MILQGENTGDQFGYCVSLSKDGNRLAVSSIIPEIVYTYEYGENGLWKKIGSSITSTELDDNNGVSLQFNGDGTRLVIGACFRNTIADEKVGLTRVFEWDPGVEDWVKLGNDIFGVNANDLSGRRVCINFAGDVIAIGEPFTDINISNSGSVKIYKLEQSTWIQKGETIIGEESNAEFGYGLSIDDTGNIVAIGAQYKNDSKGEVKGI